MSSPETVLQNKDTAIGADLYLSFELGDKRWKLTMSDGRRGPSRYTVGAGDRAAVLDCIRKAKVRCGLDAGAKAHSCYEAGRDGWWLHRWLLEQGIDSIVVDSSSIEVNRRAKRAKTDRLDGDKLLGLLLRYHGGERRVWSVLHEPTPQQEDARIWIDPGDACTSTETTRLFPELFFTIEGSPGSGLGALQFA